MKMIYHSEIIMKDIQIFLPKKIQIYYYVLIKIRVL
jgi:hypothetical protein